MTTHVRSGDAGAKSRRSSPVADGVSIEETGGLATYEFEFAGKSPLLMNHDNIAAQDEIKKWWDDPANAKSSVRGDDRSPAWTWQTRLYEAESRVSIPNRVVMSVLRKAGGMIRVPGGRNGKTFKDVTQYGLIPHDDGYDLLIDGEPIDLGPVVEVWGVNDFDRQLDVVRSLGFDLFVARAKPQTGNRGGKHVRVRPIFRQWTLKGRFDVTEAAVTDDVLRQLMAYAGKRVGIGDWRPSAPAAPGTHGRFDVRVERIA